ncbi:MAG: metallophosphoesterase [Candidatus Schekmanbacteria bacterium]|nr:metallophosphoesterase [Candidatus Schekmanbacteria bacterium]
MVRIVVIGDIHGRWDADDQSYYRSLRTDLLLWTGDLGDTIADGLRVAGMLSSLGEHSFGVLGNHDGAETLLVIAEALGLDLVASVLGWRHAERVTALRRVLGGHDLGLAARELPQLGLAIVGMRPHTSGGERISFSRTLRKVYQCVDPHATLRARIAATTATNLVLLGHNGPTGLGDSHLSPFGVDWRRGGGDNGDPDFAAALEHAEACGKRVLVAIGGHMHDRLKALAFRGLRRAPFARYGTVPIVNACTVPRIRRHKSSTLHAHVELRVDGDAGLAAADRVFWSPSAGEVRRESLLAASASDTRGEPARD